MKTPTVVLLAALLPAAAFAQVQIQIPLPTIRFEAPPPLVVVTPGVQVVPDYDDEVFFSDGWYWVNRDDRWYRTRDHRGSWVVVERQYVPRSIVVLPRGKYRRWKVHGASVPPPGVPAGRREGGDRDRDDDRGKDHGRHRGHGKH
jgi:hypothetical protein